MLKGCLLICCSNGHCTRCPCAAVPPKTLPMGSHAYIVDALTAERLAKLGEYMMHRSMRHDGDRSSWQIDGDDIKIDHYLKNYYDYLVPKEDRSR